MRASRSSRRSDPPSLRNLTPYQARFDVDMDDTAVSKVRDPSASIRLGPEGEWIEPRPEPKLPWLSRLPWLKRYPAASIVLGGASGVLLVVLAVLLVDALRPRAIVEATTGAASSGPRGAAAAGRSTRPQTTAPAGAVACSIDVSPRRLAAPAFREIPPSVAFGPSGSVTIGYAKTPHYAAAVATTFELDGPRDAFKQWDERGLEGIVAIDGSGAEARFAVDRHGGALFKPATLRVDPRLSLGWDEGRIASLEGQRLETVWTSARRLSARPSFARRGSGYLVALRQGKRFSQVAVGAVDEHGRRASPLVLVDPDTRGETSPPRVASDGERALVAFSVREGPEQPWLVRLYAVDGAVRTDQSTRLTSREGEPTVGRDPLVVALKQHRWLVLWGGERGLDAELLDESLRPLEAPFEVTSLGALTQPVAAAAAARGDRVIVAFVSGAPRSDALWAATVVCR